MSLSKAMDRALKLAEKARIDSPPNPWVGCVIIQGSQVVGEGYTQPPGHAHAEVAALQQAGDRALGGDVYVTLEPCCHYGLTPPCVDALVQAKVKRVFVALQDPDPKVAGQGVRLLREAGIEVYEGDGADEARALLAPYILQRSHKRCYCVAKAAISVDGQMAAADGSSQWITTTEARADTHLLRAQSQAILIGAGTAVVDSPSLTVRGINQLPLKAPARVVIDPNTRVPVEGALADVSIAPTIIVTTKNASETTITQWESRGAEVLQMDEHEGGGLLSDLFIELGRRGVLQILAEGGPTLLSQLWQARLVDKLVVYVGPRILGSGKSIFAGVPVVNIEDAPVLKLHEARTLGQTVRLEYFP